MKKAVLTTFSRSSEHKKRTLPEEESGTLRVGILIRHLVQLLGEHRRTTEELHGELKSDDDYNRRQEKGRGLTTPTSVSGCFSVTELKTRSQLGLPK
jgi:hypothetical protein